MNKIFIPKTGNSTIVMAFVPTGSYYEQEKYKGISHFVEHMCLSGDSLIDTPKGRKYIKNLTLGDEIYSVHVDNNYDKHYQYKTLEVSKVIKTIQNWSENRYVLYLEHNKKIKVTGNHPLAKVNSNGILEWTEAKDLLVGDILFQRKDVASKLIINKKSEPYLYKIGYIYGYCIGDGCFIKNTIKIVSKDLDGLRRIKEYIKILYNIDIFIARRSNGKKFYNYLTIPVEVTSSLKQINYMYDKAEVSTLSWHKGFVSGFFDAEGHCGYQNNNWFISFCNTNEKVVKYLEKILISFEFKVRTKCTTYSINKFRFDVQLLTEETFEFFHYFRPAIKRKYPELSILANGIKIKKIKTIFPSKFSKSKLFKNYNLTVEPNNNYFVSGVLVHNCFKGTKNRTGQQISSSIDNVGGNLNAFTDSEITAYHATVGNKYKDLAIDVITDLISNPLFPEKELIKERQVIIQEMKMYEDDPKSYVWKIFNQLIHTKESGFYTDIIGTKQSLARIDKEIMTEYYNNKYNRRKTLLVIGDVKECDRIYDRVDCQYKRDSFNYYQGTECLVERKNITQANVVIGGKQHEHSYSNCYSQLCCTVLEALYNDMSGRLFSRVREQNNLVYRIRFGTDVYRNGDCTWAVSLGLDKNKIKKAHNMIIEELKRPVTKQEQSYLLTKLIGEAQMNLDSKSEIAHSVAYDIIRDIDYKDNLNLNCLEKKYKLIIKDLNYIITQMNFDYHTIAGVIPEE